MTALFDAHADRYDRWYDSPVGAAVFEEESACLRTVCSRFHGRWLEVGVGTGRFASALGIGEGVDPSKRMLDRAARRGIKIHTGTAEHLPFQAETYDGVLLALTLCFVDAARQVLRECARVLRSSGTLLLGVVPEDSPWGEAYARKADEAHPIYAHACFRKVDEIVAEVVEAGFVLRAAASALLWTPGEKPVSEPRVQDGVTPDAGFVALRFDPLSVRPGARDPHGTKH